ncbi:MarR family winged helix-turn-helix transcriptional regulator [Pseudonocardia acaciae]|uniref:MarR family winged helix-turn-helix transcriptional regulator n=1 Tax=Pseudonocardia acaciae TaxID=551276 RepID=UPI0004912368|nr:MarR family transcriptional regulator [Pseudonocardia acaciae]
MSVPVQTSLAGLLAQAERTVAQRLESALRSAAELTIEQWRVLALLADGLGHPMSEIAAFALVPPPTLTKIIDRLAERTLVYRRVDTQDRRRVLVFLSNRGAELHRTVRAQVADAEREVADALGDHDSGRLAELLGRLLTRLA